MNIETIIEVFNGNKHISYTYKPSIYGEYKMKTYTVNGRPYFKKSYFQEVFGIWWTENCWSIGEHIRRGQNLGYARISEDVLYPHLARQENKLLAFQNGTGKPHLDSAGKLLGLKCKQANDWLQMNVLSSKFYCSYSCMEFIKLKYKIILVVHTLLFEIS